MPDKRNIVWDENDKANNYIQDNAFYPIDKYDENVKFKAICKSADKYHFLLVPLMGQYCAKEDRNKKTPAQDWCGCSSYCMVYNWHVLERISI